MRKNDDINMLSIDSMEMLNISPDYIDEDVVLHYNMRNLPIINGSMKADLFIVTACIKGSLHADINNVAYTIGCYEVLICRPNDLVDNCMITPDFDGKVLCLTSRYLTENFSESSDIWNTLFLYGGEPVIHGNKEDIRIFNLYCEILQQKIQQRNSPYYKEIIRSIVRAAMYECLSKIGRSANPCDIGFVKQREVLFKRFIKLISEIQVKPRSVSWYVDRLCITPKHLSNVCKQVSGKTAFDWINEYVLKDIRHCLKYSDKSIKEMADGLGFPSLSFFGKYCRKHFGVSPTELRRQLRGYSI